jgi:hypothetical protein
VPASVPTGSEGASAPAPAPTAAAAAAAAGASRLGLGGHPFAKTEPYKYPQVVRSALEHGITTIEAPPPGGGVAGAAGLASAGNNNAGEAALASALQGLFEEEGDRGRHLRSVPIDVLVRVGYDTKAVSELEEGDVVLEQSPGGAGEGGGASALALVHNLTGSAIQRRLEKSPLALLAQTYRNVRIVPLLHNPEEQRRKSNSTDDSPSSSPMLGDAFSTLESLVRDGAVSRFGIVSNGMCLPPDHPLFLPVDVAVEAAGSFDGYQVTQIPVNALETAGLGVARELAARVRRPSAAGGARHETYAMRPLACYPDRGAGSGHPFVLADLLIPEFTGADDPESSASSSAAGPPQLHWTNELPDAPPAAYERALKLSMQHFDADELVQAKLDGKALTAEQRETLDGCKLLQSLFHDLDAGLAAQRSLAAHDEYLYRSVIPVIHDTFESYDEETAQVLERFFAAYAVAVRHAVAKNTRALLKGGAAGRGGLAQASAPTYDLPDEMRLQEFGLRFVLREPTIAKVIAGATEVDQVVENVGIAERWASEPPQEGPEPE